MTQRLLAFARRQPLQPRKTDVNDLVLEAAKLLRPTLGEHIEIESMLEGDAWPAMIDPSQLSTALINLALNARDAMPDGGKLTIETGNVFLDENYAKANPDVAPGPYVMVAVSDTGTGIPEKLRERVFEPFFTTKEVGKGTGLGLSMVYGFIKQSGGHIKIYSEEGHGTTVKIYLPRAAAGAGADDAMTGDHEARQGHRDHSRGGGRRAGAHLCLRATAQPRLYGDSGRERRRSAGEGRGRRAVRPAVHRRHHARRA